MGNFLETLLSPKVGLIVLGPLVALALIKGCAEVDQDDRGRWRG